MRIALLTGPSGAGKTFVADQQRTQFHCLSYDRLMRDSIERAFPHRAGDKWDKQVWLDNSDRIDLVRTLEPAFTWQGSRPLLVEGWQLRERVWREAILTLAGYRTCTATTTALFLIQPSLERLVSERARSRHEYHRRHAEVADCQRQIEIHERLYWEQPWHGDIVRLPTKEEAVDAVREFLSTK
jgi:hypothetical protein